MEIKFKFLPNKKNENTKINEIKNPKVKITQYFK